MATLTITAKGQITLKQEFLRHLNVRPGQKVAVEKLPDGRLEVRPAAPKHSIRGFSGLLAKEGTPHYTVAQIKKFTEEAWAGKR
jgi:bifunctional DNA-binding transcriptional regulator/antitoxin component of YhaV-PrlF toxin-antitoxin module